MTLTARQRKKGQGLNALTQPEAVNVSTRSPGEKLTRAAERTLVRGKELRIRTELSGHPEANDHAPV